MRKPIKFLPPPVQWSAIYEALEYDADRDGGSTVQNKMFELRRAVRDLQGCLLNAGRKPEKNAPAVGLWNKNGPYWVLDRHQARSIVFQLSKTNSNTFVVLRNWDNHHDNYLLSLRFLTLQHKNRNLSRYRNYLIWR